MTLLKEINKLLDDMQAYTIDLYIRNAEINRREVQRPSFND